MNLDQALSEAVLGAKVRHDGMTPLAYIHYEFAGWRIQFADIMDRPGEGSSSGWTPRELDQQAEWYEFVPPAKPVKAWPDMNCTGVTTRAQAEGIKRHRRKRQAEPLPINDIGDWQAPAAKPMVNPWADAGIAASEPVKEGWAVFNDEQRSG